MRRQTLAAQTGFEKHGRKTKRERFLEEMEQIVPWTELQALVEPHYPKGENGRPPVGLSIMLRVYFLQKWFNLSDPGAEDALYESRVLRHFVGIDLGRAPVPDESTILQFRHLLEKHELGGAMLNTVNQYLESRSMRITTGTIVDATIIHAPSSTKNRSGERDPEMHQTRKGKQWYFGLKAHIGVDSVEGCYHLSGRQLPARGVFITKREQTLECSLQRCVVNVGISLLCDWDVFAFLYRHVTSLTSADQIARFVGYESSVVGAALDRLERQKLIERSRPSRGIRLYRVLNSKDVEHRRCLWELITLSESRAGRLELARQLSPVRSGCVRGDAVGRSPGSWKGQGYV